MFTSSLIQFQLPPQISDRQPLLIALLCALILHALLFLLPLSITTERALHRTPIAVTLTRTPISLPPATNVPDKHVTKEPHRKQEGELAPPKDKEQAAVRKSATPSEPQSTIIVQPTPEEIPQPVTNLTEDKVSPAINQNTQGTEKVEGAKSRSTIFNPRLAGRIRRERNKVQNFTAPSTEFMTATGTYIQHGDRCVEVKKLILSDIDSNLSQPFKVKCTKRRRAQEDIDRLTRKYGIP